MSSLLILLLIAPIAIALNYCSPPSWQTIWRDDFNGSKGTLPSLDNWIFDEGHGYDGSNGDWGTGEIEAETNSTANVCLDGKGKLVITAIRDQSGNWTSARIGSSQSLPLQQPLLIFMFLSYVRFDLETVRSDFAAPPSGVLRVEAKLRLLHGLPPNSTQGYWPAFWMLGSPFRPAHQAWPSCGEIDILETINGQQLLHGTFHCGVSPGGPCHENAGLGGTIAVNATSFHVYAIELDTSLNPQELRWYLDETQYWAVSSADVGWTTWQQATAHGWFIILDLAVGGRWPGMPDDTTQSGGTMELDYVAVLTSQ